MNIQEAKETIEKALRAYFARDEIGFPLVPLRQQRPILLIGPPGIGKTAIMEQIAEECGVGLVAYTMTHHTRQSAMGLPEICTREIEGKTVHTTEYTMSEIIASIYDCMEQTGKKRGILFLDEINCVSETLAPVMLQLLQDKKFGNQHIPDDWLIVAAGNPPEYNKSVREFDVATLDRVRKIEVVPELSVWLSYAEKNQIHGVVTTYLMAHSDHFYSVSQEADEKRFVTARGWEDLSAVLKSYEILNFPVDEALIGQYLQEEKTAEEFSSYYRIYEKYGQDYGVEEILTGAFSGKIMAEKQKMAANGSAEERSVLLSLFHAALQKEASGCQKQEHTAKELSECFRQFTGLCRQKKDETYASWLQQKEQGFAVCKQQGLLKQGEEETNARVLKKLKKLEETAKKCRKNDPDQMKELFETVCELEQEKAEKEVKDILFGTYDVMVYSEYSNAYVNVGTITIDSKTKSRDFVISGYAVHVKMVDSDGNPMKGEQFSFVNTEDETDTKYFCTNTEGEAYLIVSKPGTYKAMLRKESYGTVTVTDKNVSAILRKSEP